MHEAVDADLELVVPAPRRGGMKIGRGLVLALVLWAAAMVAGMAWLLDYKNTPGESGSLSRTWPQGSLVQLDGKVPTLVMVVHPKCPCSRASVGELARLMRRVGGHVDAHVLFVRPRGVAPGWENTDLLRDASAIPGVRVHADEGGVEAGRFGALTSGQTYVYSTQGALLFAGGITSSRAHHGDNAGESRIVEIVEGTAEGRSDVPTTNVYGCELRER